MILQVADRKVGLGVMGAFVLMLSLCHSTALGQRVNFAKYQSVSASSQSGTYGPELAVDGIVSNFHSFRTANSGQPQWLELSFPRPLTLGSAHLYVGLNNDSSMGLSSFKFQYHDGNVWIDVPGASVTRNTATEIVLNFGAAATSTRFRLFTTNAGTRVIRQLAMFPPNLLDGVEQGYPLGTDVRLSLGHQRPVSASSVANNGFPKLAVDGYVDDASRWLCNGASPGQTLEIDLLDIHAVGSAHLYSGFANSNPLGDFALDWWDGSGWQPVPGGTVTGNASLAQRVGFSFTVSTSKIRLRTTTASNARVGELLLFPPREGGYPLGQDVKIGPAPSAKWDEFSDSSWGLRCNISEDRRLAFSNDRVIFAVPSVGQPALRWQLLLNHRDGSYRVRHAATGKCLALENISMAAGTRVGIEEYSGLPHQDWFLDRVSGNHFRLVNLYSGMALQSENSQWAAGSRMMVGVLGDGLLQQWRVTANPEHHPKKGLASVARDGALEEYFGKFPSAWSYSWGRQKSDAFPFMPFDHSFNPMQWGNFNWLHSGSVGPPELLLRDMQSSPKPVHVMGFNEPESTNQGFITPVNAVTRWPRLESLNAPLVSPAPVGAFNGWLADFSAQADALGLRRDYTAVHWYSAPNANNLISHLQQVYQTFGRPVWLTEFSAVRWSGTANWTYADNYNFLAEFMWRAEALPWLKRYSLFHFIESASGPNQSANDPAEAPRSNSILADGTLTPFGELYASWDGVAEVLPGKAYHVHNRGEYQRIRNLGNSAIPGAVDPGNSDEGTQWFLTPGITENTYRIISTRDGRPLRFVSGSNVSLGPPDQSNAAAEWRLAADQHGWYFIEHPATNQRLRDNGNGTFGMVPITNNGVALKWRFISPITADATAVPQGPGPVSATAGISEISLTWEELVGAASYSVYRSSASGGPWLRAADGLVDTAWTDTDLPHETEYFYAVRAINGLGESDLSAELSATTLHPFTSYASWLEGGLVEFSEQERLPSSDPDGDGMVNLMEFAFLTDPARPGVSPFRINWRNDHGVELEFVWNWRAGGITWDVLHGDDLSNVAAWTVVDPGSMFIARDGDVDRITVSPEAVFPDRGFYVLRVMEN